MSLLTGLPATISVRSLSLLYQTAAPALEDP